MKSIKEKLNEYANEQDLRMAYNGSCDNCRQGFDTGANYVLEEIENIIKSDRILGHPFPSLEMRYNQIISVVEQLKK